MESAGGEGDSKATAQRFQVAAGSPDVSGGGGEGDSKATAQRLKVAAGSPDVSGGGGEGDSKATTQRFKVAAGSPDVLAVFGCCLEGLDVAGASVGLVVESARALLPKV